MLERQSVNAASSSLQCHSCIAAEAAETNGIHPITTLRISHNKYAGLLEHVTGILPLPARHHIEYLLCSHYLPAGTSRECVNRLKVRTQDFLGVTLLAAHSFPWHFDVQILKHAA